jgi:EAL domain-containing protein (putative c-di-GMP-specific phosphodiesterase class I)
MSIDVIAEGIETEQEHAALQLLGVRLGQGYFLGRPGPLEPQTATEGSGEVPEGEDAPG